jgi:hypothetical protein
MKRTEDAWNVQQSISLLLLYDMANMVITHRFLMLECTVHVKGLKLFLSNSHASKFLVLNFCIITTTSVKNISN